MVEKHFLGERDFEFPGVWESLFKLAERIGYTYCQGTSIGRGQRSEASATLVDGIDGAVGELWATDESAAFVAQPLSAKIIFQEKNGARNKGEARCERW